MSTSTSRRGFLLATLGAAMVPLTGCGKSESESESASTPAPYEGQYKNAKGVVVLEIKNGNVIFTDPATRSKSDISFTPLENNKMIVEDSSGTFTLTFTPPDTITGLPPAIAGDAGPLKKAS